MSELLYAITLGVTSIFSLLTFTVLFIAREKEVLLPWKIIFTAVFLFLVEQALAILNYYGLYTRSLLVSGLLDIVIVSMIIYSILLKIESVRA